MGNGRSCFAGRPAPAKARVFTLDGSALGDFETPVTTAEVMLEAPCYLVARAEEVARTWRVSGILLVEEELRGGEAYLLLPVGKKGSRLTDRQMDVVLEALGKKKKKESKKKQASLSGRRVFPEAAGSDEEVCKMEATKVLPGKRTCGSRQQWRLTLETIR